MSQLSFHVTSSSPTSLHLDKIGEVDVAVLGWGRVIANQSCCQERFRYCQRPVIKGEVQWIRKGIVVSRREVLLRNGKNMLHFEEEG